ncbi:MAG: 50S ribosomal protein L7 [Clostridiales bacterium]|nr:50S ribosomal protein L7 [Clostridiales bacterium]
MKVDNKNNAALFGLCKASGNLIQGFDAVVIELKKEHTKVSGIFLASDLSSKSEKEIRFFAEKKDVHVHRINIRMDNIEKILKKRTGILAVTSSSFYKMLKDKLIRT